MHFEGKIEEGENKGQSSFHITHHLINNGGVLPCLKTKLNIQLAARTK